MKNQINFEKGVKGLLKNYIGGTMIVAIDR